MQTIDNFNFAGKKAFVRVDFNVPLDENFVITDDNRIRAALPTLKKILADGGSPIIGSHLGRPKGVDAKFSLKHIINHVSELLGVPVQFADDCMKADVQAAALKPGEVLLLENLRFYAEEEGKPRGLADDASDEEKAAAKKVVKDSQKEFVKKLASYADCYINDAFGTAHRAHASTALIAKYFPNDKMFGYVMENEIKAIDRVVKSPEHPVTVIIGGAKVSSKIGIIENILNLCDNLIIGGGMAFTFLKAEGYEVGKSLVDDTKLDYCKEMQEKAKKLGKKLLLPVDTTIADGFPDPIDGDIKVDVVDSDKIPAGKEGLDIGPKTIALFADAIKNAKTVVWNGPMGVFENPTLAKGTIGVAKALADADATTIIGGGDSAAAVNQLGFADKMSHISTGGGASLEFLEGKTLPGVAAADDKN